MSENNHHATHHKDQDVQQSIQLIPVGDGEPIVPSVQSSVAQTSKTSITNTPSPRPSWTRQRATTALIVLFFVVAVLLAVAHAIFYIRLDGTFAEDRLLEQSEVIAISLLITTLFKACLVASVGLSFAQHLWKVFRQKLLRISQIEQLFHIRSNPIELTKAKIVKDAPFLFLMAVFVWLLPLAVIYPPSSLTVTSRPYSEMRDLSLSVMNLPPPDDLDVLHPEDTSVSSLAYLLKRPVPLEYNISHAFITYDYVQPSRPLLSLAKLVLLTGEILEFPSPKSENMSYSLEYRTLQAACKEEAQNWTYVDEFADLSSPFFEIYWSNTIAEMPLPLFLNISTTRYPGVYDFNRTSRTFRYPAITQSIICEPFSVLLSVDVSYTRGVRHISHTMKDAQPMPNVTTSSYYFPYVKGSSSPSISDVPVDTPEYADWASTSRDRLTSWDLYAAMDASLRSLEQIWYGVKGKFDKSGPSEWNGTLIPFDNNSYVQQADTILDWSVFNTQRYNLTDIERESHPETFQEEFDPRRDLNLSESMINAFLVNVSISALRLNTWLVPHLVNVTEYRTTYHFSSPTKLIVPYVSSLVFALLFVGIGIWSLIANGTPATDGGFLQVVTTTTGRTEMEKLIEKNKEEEGENKLSETELLNMRIRYGELVDEGGEGTGRAGFGTLAETRPLGMKARDE